jgi:hypothetical protein
MPYAFDGAAKTITFSGSSTLSVREMWTAHIDWLAAGDNSKWGDMLFTVGRDTADIPLYVFLANGVTLVIAGVTSPVSVVDGVLKTYDNRDPFGGAVVNVRYQAPGIAIGYSATGGTGGAGASGSEVAAAVRSELSPELAAVLLLATRPAAPGTNAIAEAVWAHVARTLTSTGGTGGGSNTTVEDLLAALRATTIPVDVQKMNGFDVIGNGSTTDKWRGTGV